MQRRGPNLPQEHTQGGGGAARWWVVSHHGDTPHSQASG